MHSYKLTIELTESEARYIRSMASIGRLVDSVTRLTENIHCGTTIDHVMEQDSIAVQEDMEAAKAALDSFGRQAREQLIKQGVKPLWDQNQSIQVQGVQKRLYPDHNDQCENTHGGTSRRDSP